MSAQPFPYDVFLSHSSKDKAVVRPLAERLPACRAIAARRRRTDRLKVWPITPKRPSVGGFDKWVLKAGDRIPAKIAPPSLGSYGETGAGLAHSRVLACPTRAGRPRRMLCMSAQSFGSDWARWPTHPQRSTLTPQPACAPLNRERRFIPLRLDDAPINGSLAQFLHIDWRPASCEKAETGGSGYPCKVPETNRFTL